MLTKLPLENAAALIVGAGQGIGRSCSLALATEGADVALAARRREPLKAMFERMAEAQNRTPEEISDRFARQAALRRHVDPDDIAPGWCGSAPQFPVAQRRVEGLNRPDVYAVLGAEGSKSSIDHDASGQARQINYGSQPLDE